MRIITDNVCLLDWGNKSFTGKGGEKINWSFLIFMDEDGNRFTASCDSAHFPKLESMGKKCYGNLTLNVKLGGSSYKDIKLSYEAFKKEE